MRLQLGLGHQTLTARPTRVTALEGKGVTAAACGKAHTLFLTGKGEVLAAGQCKFGACGTAFPKKAESVTSPVLVNFPAGTVVASVACGGTFNLAIDDAGDVHSWGWSEYGVLGNGTDHQYTTEAHTASHRPRLPVPNLL